MVKILCSQCRGTSEIPGWGTKILHAALHNLKKQKHYFTPFCCYCCLVAKLCPALGTPWTVAHKPPLSMAFFQARILEWVAISSPTGSSWPRDQTCISRAGRRILYHWATREAQRLSIYTSLSSLLEMKSIYTLICWHYNKGGCFLSGLGGSLRTQGWMHPEGSCHLQIGNWLWCLSQENDEESWN